MLTPEQQAAAEATLRQWRHAAPYQVQCSYCGTLVWMQDAEPVPDNPADPYDRYACADCGADGRGQKGAGESSEESSPSRHRVRQVRARIVELAREYKEACAQHQDAHQALWQVPRPDAAGRELLMHAEQRAWDAIKHRRAALFGALSELEMMEQQGP